MIPVISDLHFGSKSGSKNIFETQMEFFEKEFFPFCLKNKVKHVLHLGDLVHNRNSIDLWILQELKKRFFKWFEDNEITFHSLVGNHDSYYRSTLSHNFLEENVNEFKFVIPYSEISTIEIENVVFGMVPYIVDYKDVEFPKCDILCGHFDVVSMPMMKNMFSSEGLDIKTFENFKTILSGHYHIKSTKRNLHYVGTQYQLTWNDFDEEKGFYVIDNSRKLKYIKNESSPKFLKLFYTESNGEMRFKVAGNEIGKVEEITSKQSIKLVKSNHMRLIVDKYESQSLLDDFHSSLMLHSMNGNKIEMIDSSEVIENFDFDEIESDIEMDSDVFSLVQNYISDMSFEEQIDKKILIDIIKDLYKKTLEEEEE